MPGNGGLPAYPTAAACLALAFGLAPGAAPALAGEVRIAVAANFTGAAYALAEAFAAATEHDVVLSFGSTGQLYAQITQGAPFDVFLAADEERPERLVQEGLAIAASRFTYAVGRLVLFSADPALVTGEGTLRDAAFDRLAIADPAAAPYGAAAVATIEALGLTATLAPKLVTGTSIAQAYQFVETGNAELGFVALSQLVEGGDGGSHWLVPEDLHPPIRQDAVLLAAAADADAAGAFLAFLAGGPGRSIIESHGYETDGE